jgi:hypothetical protein
MYNVAFSGIVVVTVKSLVELDVVSQIILQVVGVLWGSFFCSLAFVLPRLLELNKEKKVVGQQQHPHRCGNFQTGPVIQTWEQKQIDWDHPMQTYHTNQMAR